MPTYQLKQNTWLKIVNCGQKKITFLLNLITGRVGLRLTVRSLGKELLEHGIIVSGILPGAFYGDDNAMFRYEYYKPEEYLEFVKSLPKGRMPLVDEYLPMIFLLSNPKSTIMNGSLISMDGAQGQSYYNYSM